jgi:hypothetical protein
MLANAAEVREGLLYVLGGGIEQVWVADLPTDVAPTVVLSVDLDAGDLGRPFVPHVRVADAGGDLLVDLDLPPAVPEPRSADPEGAHVLRFPMVFTVPIRVARAGTHEVAVDVEGEPLAAVAFSVRVAGG